MRTEFRVPDASCGHCKITIEQAVSLLDGVRAAEMDLDSKRLLVDHDPTVGSDALRGAVLEAGYTAFHGSSGFSRRP